MDLPHSLQERDFIRSLFVPVIDRFDYTLSTYLIPHAVTPVRAHSLCRDFAVAHCTDNWTPCEPSCVLSNPWLRVYSLATTCLTQLSHCMHNFPTIAASTADATTALDSEWIFYDLAGLGHEAFAVGRTNPLLVSSNHMCHLLCSSIEVANVYPSCLVLRGNSCPLFTSHLFDGTILICRNNNDTSFASACLRAISLAHGTAQHV